MRDTVSREAEEINCQLALNYSDFQIWTPQRLNVDCRCSERVLKNSSVPFLIFFLCLLAGRVPPVGGGTAHEAALQKCCQRRIKERTSLSDHRAHSRLDCSQSLPLSLLISLFVCFDHTAGSHLTLSRLVSLISACERSLCVEHMSPDCPLFVSFHPRRPPQTPSDPQATNPPASSPLFPSPLAPLLG